MDIAMCGEGVEYGGVCPRSCTSVHGVVLGYRGGVAATPYTTSGHWKLVTHSPHIVVVCLDPFFALHWKNSGRTGRDCPEQQQPSTY